MDRVQVLIEKLSTQKAANETPVQLLVTVQLLHEELRRQLQESYSGTSSKVAVILPPVAPFIAPVAEKPVVIDEVIEKKEVVSPVIPIVEPKEEKPIFRQPSFFDVHEEPKPDIAETPVRVVDVPAEPAKEVYVLRKPTQEYANDESKTKQSTALPFDVIEEIPTLSQRQPQPQPREVHELIGAKEASLNDRLKQDKTELVNVLKDAPIKDLRKGIGVNDKFLFINELFRGDEGLYDRSIKTINAFNILPEAEYWINRELKIKLGWNDDKEVVQYFYQLVKRRFS